MECDTCGLGFDPIATRWLCPHCHTKANRCDGAPLPPMGPPRKFLIDMGAPYCPVPGGEEVPHAP
jgi:hypothetical protein